MDVLLKVLGMTVAGVLVIALYIATTVLCNYLGLGSPLAFMIYLGLALTATFLATVMYLVSTGDAEG